MQPQRQKESVLGIRPSRCRMISSLAYEHSFAGYPFSIVYAFVLKTTFVDHGSSSEPPTFIKLSIVVQCFVYISFKFDHIELPI